MVVIVIVSALLGLSLGALRRFDGADRRAVMQVKDAMRTARQAALAQGAPASVVVDAEAGEVYSLGLRAVGNWHFEDIEGTGWPVAAEHESTALHSGGVLGWGLQLRNEDVLNIGDLPPTFDSPHGFGVDVWVAPEADPRPMTILERPGLWSLGFDFQGELGVSFWLRPEAEQDGGPGGPSGTGGVEPVSFRQSWPEVSLPSERPSRLTVVFDGRHLHLSVDGRLAAEETVFPSRRRLALVPGSLLRTGAGPTRFRGSMDELRIFSVVLADHEPLPVEVALQGPSRVLRIAASGHLDPAFHVAPEVVRLTFGDPPVQLSVEYGLLGTVQSWSDRATDVGP